MEPEVIEACKRGDRRAIEEIFHLYKSRMKSWCYRYSKNDFDTEEILQESFIKIFSNIRSYEHSGSFEGWIRKIVVNTSINYYKKNIKFSLQAGYETAEHAVADDREIISRLSLEELHEHIRNLPDGYRMVFVMFAIEGYSHKEIAEVLNIKENTSSSQYTKAKKYLINSLQKHGVVSNGK
jgi:RNA polymerase sigma factor (sigma-70 family)